MAKKLDAQAPDLRPFPRVQKHFYKPTKTRASEMASTDLNAIVNRFRLSGALPPSHLRYGDVTGLPGSKLEAMERIEAAREAFEALPLKVRQAIGHDPRRLEDWIVGNPQLAAEYGLLVNTQKSPPPENPPASSGKPQKAPTGASEGSGGAEGGDKA